MVEIKEHFNGEQLHCLLVGAEIMRFLMASQTINLLEKYSQIVAKRYLNLTYAMRVLH